MRRLAAGFLFLCVIACRRETPQPPPPPATTTTAQASNAPRSGGRLFRRIENDVKTLNYILHAEEEERQVLAYIYEPLVAFDQNLAPIPCLATKWEITDGGRTFTLHLDPRATFSDGMPVKASDVVFTVNKIVDEDAPQFAGWFEGLDREQTKALDDHTARVVFKEARVTRLLSFNISVVPEHVYGKGDLSKINQVVGNGPYVLKRRDSGRSILVERRADYWREKPYIDSVFFRVVADESVAWNAFMRGDLDVGRVNNDLWWREKDKPEVQRKFTFFNAWLLSYNCFVWNLEDPLFDDARVRRALAMTFDRRTVIEKMYHGQARPVTGPFTPDQWAYNEEVLPIEFNPQAASAVLASAGWRDSDGDGILDREGRKFAFTMLIPLGNVARDQAQIFQDALLKVGIRMEILSMEGAAFFDRVLKRNYQAAFFAWFLEPDPDRDLFSLFHSSQKAPVGFNVGGYANAEADDLIVKGRLELDRGRRAEIYHQLHELLARDQPYLWTVQVSSKWAVNRRVQNVRISNGLGLFLWYPGPLAWWLKE
jgi:peptide/nickel transport system substrate-binding protein